MPVGVWLIVVGILTIGWCQLLLPHQLRKSREGTKLRGGQLYDAYFTRPAVRGLLRWAPVIGYVAVVVGVVYLLTEL
jgi:hypothetical protein